jgi:hypothetical protein
LDRVDDSSIGGKSSDSDRMRLEYPFKRGLLLGDAIDHHLRNKLGRFAGVSNVDRRKADRSRSGLHQLDHAPNSNGCRDCGHVSTNTSVAPKIVNKSLFRVNPVVFHTKLFGYDPAHFECTIAIYTGRAASHEFIIRNWRPFVLGWNVRKVAIAGIAV